MAGAKNHQYHILEPSIWPLIGALSAMAMFFGLIMWFHPDHFGTGGPWVFGAGLIGVLFTMFSWWTDVVREANGGDHTPIVQLHLRYGMILFIASEVMFFVDPKILDDPDARDISEITLSYTFYPVEQPGTGS